MAKTSWQKLISFISYCFNVFLISIVAKLHMFCLYCFPIHIRIIATIITWLLGIIILFHLPSGLGFSSSTGISWANVFYIIMT